MLLCSSAPFFCCGVAPLRAPLGFAAGASAATDSVGVARAEGVTEGAGCSSMSPQSSSSFAQSITLGPGCRSWAAVWVGK